MRDLEVTRGHPRAKEFVKNPKRASENGKRVSFDLVTRTFFSDLSAGCR